MSFHDIKPVDKSQFYLDLAFRKMSQIHKKKERGPDNIYRARRKELAKIDMIKGTIISKLDLIVKDFPIVDELPEFYAELLKVTIDRDKLKQSLAKLVWTKKTIQDITRQSASRISRTGDEKRLVIARKAFMGRISSVFEKLTATFDFLEEARREMKEFPMIKTNLFTVCIAGFPNVGKSTLLSKLTTSKPEIKNYAFTSKRMNLGYAEIDGTKVQFIDAPGTLARPDKMNNIEKQAYLAIKHQADLIVYIFDLTDTYPMEAQKRLLEIVKEYGKPIIIFLSKTDLLEDETIKEFKNELPILTSIDDLREEIVERKKNNDRINSTKDKADI